MSGVSASMSRGCYEKTAPVKFKLYYAGRIYDGKHKATVWCPFVRLSVRLSVSPVFFYKRT